MKKIIIGILISLILLSGCIEEVVEEEQTIDYKEQIENYLNGLGLWEKATAFTETEVKTVVLLLKVGDEDVPLVEELEKYSIEEGFVWYYVAIGWDTLYKYYPEEKFYKTYLSDGETACQYVISKEVYELSLVDEAKAWESVLIKCEDVE